MTDIKGPENPLVAIGKMAETMLATYAQAGKQLLVTFGVIAAKTRSDYTLCCPDDEEVRR